MRQDHVDLDIADVPRAGARRDLAQVVRREHQRSSARRRGTSASRSLPRAIDVQAPGAT